MVPYYSSIQYRYQVFRFLCVIFLQLLYFTRLNVISHLHPRVNVRISSFFSANSQSSSINDDDDEPNAEHPLINAPPSNKAFPCSVRMVAISSKSINPRPPLWKVWLIASRPHTLTAAIAPCIAGACITYHHSKQIPTGIICLWTLFCILVQLGTNLHNDYADFVKGADTEARVGQSRATQKGWLTPDQTAAGATTMLTGNLVIGVYFLQQLSVHNHGQVDMFFLFIVLSSIFNAFAYTGGPYPLGYIGLGNFSLGYSGLGDIFVFLYFGIVATAAIPYLHYRMVENPGKSINNCLSYLFLNKEKPTLSLVCVEVGLMATNILVVNNLRDRHTDKHAGKKTLAVRFGGTFCRLQYTLQALASYVLVFLDFTLDHQKTGKENYVRLLPLLSLPLVRREIFEVWRTDGADLNSHVGKTAMLEFLFCILLGAALVKSS